MELDNKDKDRNFLWPHIAHRSKEDFLFLHLLLLTGTHMAMEHHHHGYRLDMCLLEYHMDHLLQQHLQEQLHLELIPQVPLCLEHH